MTFFYDEGCGFCRKRADWIERRTGLDIQPLTEAQLAETDKARYIREGQEFLGHRAIAEALKDSPMRRHRLAAFWLKLFSPVFRLVYWLTAKHRRTYS